MREGGGQPPSPLALAMDYPAIFAMAFRKKVKFTDSSKVLGVEPSGTEPTLESYRARM